MDLGRGINPVPCPDKLILGANSELLNNADFVVTQLTPTKPFAYEPFFMKTSFHFIEGYVGNDTIRQWKEFQSIYHAVFACTRGTPGYPKGEAVETVPGGLLLRPAIPSPEIFGVSNTYGPMANFKISLRELPETGNFRVTVNAARYDDGLLLDPDALVQDPSDAKSISISLSEPLSSPETNVNVTEAGVYQVDVYRSTGDSKEGMSLALGDRNFSGRLHDSGTPKRPPAAHRGLADMHQPLCWSGWPPGL